MAVGSQIQCRNWDCGMREKLQYINDIWVKREYVSGPGTALGILLLY